MIAVIVVLAGILLPAIARAREQSRSSNCQQHLRQLGMILNYYHNDYDFYPAHQWKLVVGATTVRLRWFTQFGVYVSASNKDVMRCPSRPEWPVGRNNSYGYNYKYLGSSRGNAGSPTAPFERFPVRMVAAPTATIAFGDCDGTGTKEPYEPIPESQAKSALSGGVRRERIGNHGYTLDPTYIPSWSTTQGDSRADADHHSHLSTRHNNGSNIVFVDGHVKHMLPADAYVDNALWNGLGVEDPTRDDHVTTKAPNFRY